GPAVYDGTTWARVAGPWKDRCASWEAVRRIDRDSQADRLVVCRVEQEPGRPTSTWMIERVVDLTAGRDVAFDPSLGPVGGFGVLFLPDGRFVARTDTSVCLRDRDGKLLRLLVPPQEASR